MLDYRNLFSSNEYDKNDKKIYCIICGNNREFEKPKISYNFWKTLFLSIVCSKCEIIIRIIIIRIKNKNQLRY